MLVRESAYNFHKTGEIRKDLGIGKYSNPIFNMADILKSNIPKYIDYLIKKFYSDRYRLAIYQDLKDNIQEDDIQIFINEEGSSIYLTLSENLIELLESSKTLLLRHSLFNMEDFFNGFFDYLHNYGGFDEISRICKKISPESYIDIKSSIMRVIIHEPFAREFPPKWIFFRLAIYKYTF